ncbi:MAG TPA: flagellar hook assembly protein FlgD [Pseudogracilibacillus sp.]|nr:flagellar hook assembly protein FlgD [Pseudogracilibacillus sp.]
MPKIDTSFYLANTEKRSPSSELGKEEFLKILMAQLQNQDPLNPLDDKDFIAQMATFSSLEQLMNMSQSIDALVQNQLISPIVQYSHMIGKEVSYISKDEQGNQKTVNSKVKAVSQEDGWAVFELENGEKIVADSILKVKAETTEDDKA